MSYICDFYLKSGLCKRHSFTTDPDDCQIKSHANKYLGGFENIEKIDCFHNSENGYQLYFFDGEKWIENINQQTDETNP